MWPPRPFICRWRKGQSLPEHTAFVPFRKSLVGHSLDKALFNEITVNSRP
jgi:hypothetical protein